MINNIEGARHLQWICDRLVHVHGENPSAEYMVKLDDVIEALRMSSRNLNTQGTPPAPAPTPTPHVEGCECKQVGDVLVIATADHLREEQVKRVTALINERLPGRQVLVVPPGWKVSTVKADDLRVLRGSIDEVLQELQNKENKS